MICETSYVKLTFITITYLLLCVHGQTNIIGATAADRNILLYDTRGSAPLRKVVILYFLAFWSL